MSYSGEVSPPKKYKYTYAEDVFGHGFFWVESRQKLEEAQTVRRNAPADFEAVYQGRPGAREGSIFLDKDLNAFYELNIAGVPFPITELQIGTASPYVQKFVQQGHTVIQAWDTAFSTSSQAAYSVCVTALLVPCQSYHCDEDETLLGPCEYHFDVLILSVYRKRLDWGALTEQVKREYYLWKPSEIVIEKKASGQSLIQNFNSSSLPIIGIGAKNSKGDRALNSVTVKTAGSVQGWFRQHRVLTPRYAPWLEVWRTEMKDFSGDDDTSSDQVDATVHLVTRAIMMGATMAVLPTDWTPQRSALPNVLTDAGQIPEGFNDPRAGMLLALGMLQSLTEDPFQGTCSRCTHDGANFCVIQGRRMLAMDSCPAFIEKGTESDGTDASTGIESALRFVL